MLRGCFRAELTLVSSLRPTPPPDAALNEEFYRSLPNPVREIVKMRTGDVAASHDLTRAASMAMILLHRARSQPVGGAEAEALLIKQSDNYFQQAVMHLETAAIPLEAQLVAVADMQVSTAPRRRATRRAPPPLLRRR